MPSKYSHGVVLAQYSSLGLIDLANNDYVSLVKHVNKRDHYKGTYMRQSRKDTVQRHPDRTTFADGSYIQTKQEKGRLQLPQSGRLSSRVVLDEEVSPPKSQRPTLKETLGQSSSFTPETRKRYTNPGADSGRSRSCHAGRVKPTEVNVGEIPAVPNLADKTAFRRKAPPPYLKTNEKRRDLPSDLPTPPSSNRGSDERTRRQRNGQATSRPNANPQERLFGKCDEASHRQNLVRERKNSHRCGGNKSGTEQSRSMHNLPLQSPNTLAHQASTFSVQTVIASPAISDKANQPQRQNDSLHGRGKEHGSFDSLDRAWVYEREQKSSEIDPPTPLAEQPQEIDYVSSDEDDCGARVSCDGVITKKNGGAKNPSFVMELLKSEQRPTPVLTPPTSSHDQKARVDSVRNDDSSRPTRQLLSPLRLNPPTKPMAESKYRPELQTRPTSPLFTRPKRITDRDLGTPSPLDILRDAKLPGSSNGPTFNPPNLSYFTSKPGETESPSTKLTSSEATAHALRSLLALQEYQQQQMEQQQERKKPARDFQRRLQRQSVPPSPPNQIRQQPDLQHPLPRRKRSQSMSQTPDRGPTFGEMAVDHDPFAETSTRRLGRYGPSNFSISEKENMYDQLGLEYEPDFDTDIDSEDEFNEGWDDDERSDIQDEESPYEDYGQRASVTRDESRQGGNQGRGHSHTCSMIPDAQPEPPDLPSDFDQAPYPDIPRSRSKRFKARAMPGTAVRDQAGQNARMERLGMRRGLNSAANSGEAGILAEGVDDGRILNFKYKGKGKGVLLGRFGKKV
ncbi:hypothetical protein UCRPC4_g00434 [Phaeomoniella chlamydospora]|uniref:Uncharacterized protein n=1 Tax=Phaeomoniella chlamydospora TaxID=158046 RepID=A0A0G2GZT0_PHACM|nr:hypothetical protein UCRPC4_g00434 [Phaeomoniella chlamydospora]